MDTRYWGPSGWRLLHLISFAAPTLNKKDVCSFFTALPYVLPCKYCRKSLSEYVQADPIECNENVARWLWRIHNDVNAKLRVQRLSDVEDPPFSEVKKIYESRLSLPCTKTVFEGWEFLFSVAESHPNSAAGRSSEPIKIVESDDPLERNRWNIMTPEERLPHYELFWSMLPRVLPFREWRLQSTIDATSRQSTLKSLWSMRCEMETKLELLNRTSFASLCSELKHYRSGCSTSKRGKTCRRKR
jgi:Erv1 / Alr family